MAATGPLSGKLEVHFFDTGKLKTTSIVSYGVRHIVNIAGEDSLFRLWHGPGKTKVKNHIGKAELATYIDFASSQLNMLIRGFRANVDATLWTTDRSVSRALSATTVNGLIFCMRQLIKNGRVGSKFDYYRDGFAKMQVDFRPKKFPYKSSHWRDLGDALYRQCFL
jgi:hypothetical protein